MAAIRLGSALSSLTGTSKQLLRVNEGETGFEFFSPASIPTYTTSNVTTDREFNANDTSLDELADVVGTLIADLAAVINGNGLAAFAWSTSEQVYPFEKDTDGSTLYCKYFQVSYSGTYGAWAHGISNSNGSKVRRVFGQMIGNAGMSESRPLPFVSSNYSTNSVGIKADGTNIILESAASYPSVTCNLFMIYAK